jgi:hypothetical protein
MPQALRQNVILRSFVRLRINSAEESAFAFCLSANLKNLSWTKADPSLALRMTSD